jgi:serine/threonine protein kinase
MAERSSPREYFRNKKRYKETGLLGKGGMAIVSESNDGYFQRAVAYKKMKPGPSMERKTKEFVREALIMGQLEHPGILPVHALLLEEGELPAMTMDKVLGKSMAEIILKAKSSPEDWPLARRYRIFQRLVEIVAYTHSRGILHRDLKPANIMIGDQEEVILLDWGLAKVLKKKDLEKEAEEDGMVELKSGQHSVSGSIKGTPFYMSPESAQGRVERVRETTDVFSLGAIFYEMLTLERLVKGEKVNDVLKNAAEGNYVSLNREVISRHIKPNGNRLSEEWHHVLKKMVTSERKNRYRDASALHQDITSIFEERALEGFKSALGMYSLKKFMKRRGWLMAMTLLPILITLIWGAFLGSDRERLDSEREALELENVSLEKRVDTMGDEVKAREKELEEFGKKIDALIRESVEIQDQALGLQDSAAKKTVDQDKLSRDVQLLEQELEFFEEAVALAKEEADEKKELFNMGRNSFRQQESETRQELFFKNTREHGIEVFNLLKDVEAGRLRRGLRTFQSSYFFRDDPLVSRWMVKVLGKSSPSEGGKLDLPSLAWWDALSAAPEWRSFQAWDADVNSLTRWSGLPPGYRVVKGGASEKKWLIAFLSPGRIKYREFDPKSNEKGEPWSLEAPRPRAAFPTGDGGWLILDIEGSLHMLEDNLPPRPMQLIKGIPVDRVFTIPDLNLVVAQDRGNNLLLYYLNTGQWLFHAGRTGSPLEEVGVDDSNQLYLVEESGRVHRASL